MSRIRSTLGIALGTLLTIAATPASAQVFPSPSVAADTTFADALGGTSMTLTWDGTSYWSSSGGGPSGTRYAQYNGSGGFVASYAPGLDFRSVFTMGGSTVYARAFNDSTIYQQTSPGVFGPSGVVLAGSLNAQSAVVSNGPATEYIALSGGAVLRWDLSGTYLGSVPLVGFGSQNGEANYPQNRGVAGYGNHYITYANGVASAWNACGVRVEQATLTGAGTSFDSHFSLSFANGRIWVVDVAGGTWRGYPLLPIGPPGTVAADKTFTDALGGTSMTLAWDGTFYWSSSGGGPSGTRYAQYNASGGFVASYAPGLDFRSVFTLGGSTVYARAFADSTIYQQTSPGVFGPSGVVLSGFFDGQSSVVSNGSANEYIALSGGAVLRWNLSGTSLGSVPLIGFGSQNGEGNYPQNRGVAAFGGYYITYANGVASWWDLSGNRVTQTTLTGAGTSFDSHFSLSFANDRIWVVDVAGGTWRGYPMTPTTTIGVSPASLPAGTVGTYYTQTMSASCGVAPYTFALTAGSLPAGLTLSGAGTISGTPTAGGSFSFTVTATDANGATGSQACTLTINPPTIVVNPASPLPSNYANLPYSATITASGGTPSYTFAVTAGALPPGLTLSAGGLLSGTPTAAGTFNFTVTATDSSTGTGPYTGSRAYTLVLVQMTFDASFLDDARATRVCINTGNGNFMWKVLTGPNAGTTRYGTSIVASSAVGLLFKQTVGVPYKFSFQINRIGRSASGSYVEGAKFLSFLSDTNIDNNPPADCRP